MQLEGLPTTGQNGLVFMWVTNNWSGCCLGFRLCYLPLDLFSLAGLPCLGSVREDALIPDAT